MLTQYIEGRERVLGRRKTDKRIDELEELLWHYADRLAELERERLEEMGR